MKFDVIIGLEVHVQVMTKSKMFCSCPNRYGSDPNTLVCPICMGYPGVLPVPNNEAIRKTLLAGLMCECNIALYSKFDRKSYFYPDMPKNYQISQYDLPFCEDGKVVISGKGLSKEFVETKPIGITRIHLEEDVAKSTHFRQCSGIDFNRAGVPLMEIVSEPDISTPDEAYIYLTALKQIMQYADISDCDMEKGQMRCDVNVSLKSPESPTLNAKTEVKNLNSLKAVHRSLLYETERQSEVLEGNGQLIQQTRGWNDDIGETYILRTKEDAADYRYFPEPDLMPVEISSDYLEKLKKEVPETPAQRCARFIREFAIPEYDASVLTSNKSCADYFEKCISFGSDAKKTSNWTMVELLRELSQANKTFDQCPVNPENFAELIKLIDNKTINGKIAKAVFSDMFSSGKTALEIIDEKGLKQVTDTDEILQFVKKAVESNPTPVQQLKEGKSTALNFLVGQVMKFSKGKANPQLASDMIKKELS